MLRAIFLDPTGRLRTVWRFAVFAVGFVIVQVIVGLIVGVGFVVWQVSSGGPDAFGGGSIADWILPVTILSAPPVAAVTAGWVLVCRRWLDRRSVASLGWVWPERRPGASVTVGLAAGVAAVGVPLGVAWAAGGYRLEGFAFSPLAASLAPALVLMAFAEETVCRSYLLQNLVDVGRPVFGVLFTSAVFWLLHGANPGVWDTPLPAVNLFLAGVVLGLGYLASGNIWFPTALHFGWNVTQGVILGVPISGTEVPGLVDLQTVASAPAWLSGGSFGPEGSLLVTGSEVLLAALLLPAAWSRRHRAAPAPAPDVALESEEQAETALSDLQP